MTSEPRQFHAQFMGTFAFGEAGGQDLCPSGQKPRAILAYLLFHAGQKLTREKLVSVFWTDRGPKQGRDSLRQALHLLRSCMGDHVDALLEVDRTSLLIRERLVSFDLWENETLRWDRHGSFLEGMGQVSPAFEDWVADTERDIRRRQILRAEAHLRDLEAGNDKDGTLACVDQILALDPHHEPAVQSALRIHAVRGDRSHAQRLFERLYLALNRDDLAVSEETQSLMQEINTNTAPAPVRHPTALRQKSDRGLPTVRVDLPNEALPPNFAPTIMDFVDHLVERIVDMPELTYSTTDDPTSFQDYVIDVVTGTKQSGLRISLRLKSADAQYVWSGRSEISAQADDTAVMLSVDKSVMQMLPALEEHFFFANTGAAETAYGLYIEAKRLFWMSPKRGYIERVISLLERAIDIDPDFLPPYGMLIMYYNTGMFMNNPGAAHGLNRGLAYELAQKLMFRNSKYANSHISMAWCHLWQHSFNAAERSIRAAIDLNPYEPHRLNVIGTALVYLGHYDEGQYYYDKAQERIHHDFGFQRTDYGELQFLRKDYAGALAWMEVPETRTPYKTFFFRALANAKLGRIDQANNDVVAFEKDIRTRWCGADPFTLESGFQWYVNTMPLREVADRQTVERAIAELGISASFRHFP